jgi:hypothetical protein
MGAPQDWAPYSSVDEAAKVYLRDPALALAQMQRLLQFGRVLSRCVE